MTESFPLYSKPLPQIWIENDQYVIESPAFRYVIDISNNRKAKRSDPLTMLFKLCRKLDRETIASTYTSLNESLARDPHRV